MGGRRRSPWAQTPRPRRPQEQAWRRALPPRRIRKEPCRGFFGAPNSERFASGFASSFPTLRPPSHSSRPLRSFARRTPVSRSPLPRALPLPVLEAPCDVFNSIGIWEKRTSSHVPPCRGNPAEATPRTRQSVPAPKHTRTPALPLIHIYNGVHSSDFLSGRGGRQQPRRKRESDETAATINTSAPKMSSSTAVGDETQAVPVAPEPTWYDDSVERYSNPAAYARKHAPQPAPTPALQEEISLAVPGGQAAKLEASLLLLVRSGDEGHPRRRLSRVPLVYTAACLLER